MILPDLGKRLEWYKAVMSPEDPEQGPGISNWTITAEYVPRAQLAQWYGAPVWGCMGSPESRGLEKLTPENVAAKRAHILVCMPETAEDLKEADRTLVHECGHILVAHLGIPRAEQENIMHSLDHLYSKLTPEEGVALARAIADPTARAYRAAAKKEGDMPDPTNEENKDKPDKEAAAAQEGSAEMSVEEIKAALVKAVLDGQPTEELAKKLVAAMATAGAEAASPPPAPEPMPEAAPTMGMKPEEAYARGQKSGEAAATAKANREAVKAFAESLDDDRVTPEQRAEIAEAPSMARAQRLLKTYPRATQGATLGVSAGKVTGAKPGAIGLQDTQAAAMARQMGAKSNKVIGPHMQKNGRFSMGTMTPTQLREAIAAGKDPRNQFPSTLGD